MFIIDFLFYYAYLLGKRRETLWQDGRLAAFYVISGIVGLWIMCAIKTIEENRMAYIHGVWRMVIYIVLPLLIIFSLAIYYKCFEKSIMERWWQRTMKYGILQMPFCLVLFVYCMFTIILMVCVLHE